MGAACGTAAVDSALPAAVGGAAAAGAANPCAAIIACTFAPYSSSIRLQKWGWSGRGGSDRPSRTHRCETAVRCSGTQRQFSMPTFF